MRRLNTRDGSRIGNAIVYAVRGIPKFGELICIETDFGNRIRLTLSEVDEMFTLAERRDYREWKRDRAALQSNEIWQPISAAPKTPKTGIRGPIIIGIDETGLLGRTAWCYDHSKGSDCWLLFSGEGLMEWKPVYWVPNIIDSKERAFTRSDTRSF